MKLQGVENCIHESMQMNWYDKEPEFQYLKIHEL